MTEAGDLERGHAQLLRQRRSSIGKGLPGRRTREPHCGLLKIQSAIEALDAVADEEEDEHSEE